MDAAIKTALEAVVEHLRRDGLGARMGDECAYLGVGDAALVVISSQFQASPDGQLHSANLRVAVRLGERKPLLFEDMLAHLGRSQEEAAVSALLRVWLHGDLPPILQLLGGPVLPELEVFEHPLDCSSWVVHSGPHQLSGSTDLEQFAQALGKSPPLGVLQNLLEQDLEKDLPHWLKLFRCRDTGDGGSDQVDCLVDFRQIEQGKDLLTQWPWPSVVGRHSFRQFLLLIPRAWSVEQALKALERRYATPAATVARLAEIVAGRAEFSEDEIYAAMADAGIPEAVADRAYKFTQTAWGRLFLDGMGVQFLPDYLCFNGAGDIVASGVLNEEPYFAAAATLFPQYAGSPGLLRLAMMSAVVHGLNDSLNAGSKPENLVMGPAAMFLEPATSAGMEKAQRVLAQRALATSDSEARASAPSAKKPWWRFW